MMTETINPNDTHIDVGESTTSQLAHIGSQRSDSIPVKLKRWYSHTSYKNLILSFLSTIIIANSFAGLFIKILTPCEVLGISTSILLLFTPSPLSKPH